MRAGAIVVVLLALVVWPAHAQAPSGAPSTINLPHVVVPIPLGEIYVRSHRAFTVTESDVSTVYIVGEVVNGAPFTITTVAVLASFYDDEDHLVAATTGYTQVRSLDSGERTPFKFSFVNPPVWTHYTLTVREMKQLFPWHRRVKIISQQVRDNGGVEVFGELRNDSSVTIKNPRAIVTFYTSGGAVLDAAWADDSPQQLLPGATAMYTITTGVAIPYASYTVQAESEDEIQ